MKTALTHLVTALCLVTVASCSGEWDLFAGGTVVSKRKPSTYADLTRPDDTLINLELAYENRSLDEINRLLHVDFVFYFGQADIDNGYVPVTSWRRTDELTATAHLFDPTPFARTAFRRDEDLAADSAETATEESSWGRVKALYLGDPQVVDGPVSRIQLDLVYAEGDSAWEPAAACSGCLEKTVDYRLTITAGTFIFTNANPITARIRIAPVTRLFETTWQIVQWLDDV